MKTHKKWMAAIALATATSTGAACMGNFTLTKKLYGFNETITSSKLVNNLIFWALLILPVYELATLGDALIFNVIEFWTGKNLLADASGTGDELRLTHNGAELVAKRLKGGEVAVFSDGVYLGLLRATDRGVVIEDKNGDVVDALAVDEMQAAEPALFSAPATGR